MRACRNSDMNRRYQVVSLFSGAGGMDSGFSLSNAFRTIMANDIISPPASTFVKNFGGKVVFVEDLDRLSLEEEPTYVLGDVSLIDFKKLPIQADVLIGGPPCQDFSIVRGIEEERRGIHVERGKLYAQFVRALAELQPSMFVFENVPGLKSANNGTAYHTIVNDFAHLESVLGFEGDSGKDSSDVNGYYLVFSGIVDSASFGAPQRRRRLIIIGVRNDLLKGTSVKREIRQRVNYKLSGGHLLFSRFPLTPLEVFEGRVLPELQAQYHEVMSEYSELVGLDTERAKKWKKLVWDRLSFDIVRDYMDANSISLTSPEEIEKAFEEHERLLRTLAYYGRRIEDLQFPDGSNNILKESKNVLQRLQMIPPGENHEFVQGTPWEVSGRGISLIYRRLHPLKPSYTVVAYGGGGTWGYHYKRNRGKLTNRERARLQTFPDDFQFHGNQYEMRAQIGEAVPTVLALAIADTVQEVLGLL